jgi:hypothetical protein
MDGEATGAQREEWDLLQTGVPVRFDLDTPCRSFDRGGLLCGLTEAYIQVKPFGTSFHYQRRCANGHCTDNVPHAEVELRFGIPRTAPEKKAAVRDALTPSRRVALNVLIRDQSTCVYCGRRVGDLELDGTPVVVGADHIIAKPLIDAEWIRRDRELFQFAKEIQLVTACRSDNSAKQTALIDLDDARDIFIRHVLKGQTRGANLGLVSLFERLHRIVALNLRMKTQGAGTRPTTGRDEVR